MAVTFFSDLRTEADLKAFDEHLSGKSYISGEEMTRADFEVYLLCENKPSSESYPNASKWYDAVKDELVSSFLGKASAVSVGRQAASVEAAAKSKSTAEGDDVEESGNLQRVPLKRKIDSTAEDNVGKETEKDKESIKKKESRNVWKMALVVLVRRDGASVIQDKVRNIEKDLPHVAHASSRVFRETDRFKGLMIELTMVGVGLEDDEMLRNEVKEKLGLSNTRFKFLGV